METPKSLSALLLVGSVCGQDPTRTNCDFNSDAIFFDNEELEKLRASFQFGEGCSPSSWKGDFGDYLQNHLRDGRAVPDLSDRDRTLLNEFAKRQPSKKPDQEEFGLESASQGVTQFQMPLKSHGPDVPSWETSGDISLEGERSDERIPSRSYSESQRIRQNRQQLGLFRPDDQFSQRNPEFNQREFFPRDGPGFHDRPGEFFGSRPEYPNHGRFDFLSPKGRRPPNQGNFFPPGNTRRPEIRPRPEDFFGVPGGPQNQRQSETLANSRPQRRPQNHNRPDFLRPNQRRPPMQKRKPQVDDVPDNFIMPDSVPPRPEPATPNQLLIPRPQTTSTTPRPTSTTEPGPPAWATPPSLCVRRCPNTPEYNPVCGSDNVSYINPGRLRCEQGCGKANVSLRHYGNCATTAAPSGTTPGST